ncbi:MAG: N-acetylmuramoyl-L-alanine amidase [Pseudomonadota bacterium]|nr:N-acetylmuramoyl-L-alanine amidase [Pseudomonadota bacterium]
MVAVDVGHHYEAPGVLSASGKAELEFNLELAYEVRRSLSEAGFAVRMIEDRPLYDRTAAAEGADFFVSIHHDSVKPEYMPVAASFSGYSLFISRLNPQPQKSLACASAIGSQLRAAGLVPSRYHADPVLGEHRPFADEVNGVHFFDNLAVARTASMPSVLVEAGVIVNRDEERRLSDPEVRERIARAIAGGIQACLP